MKKLFLLLGIILVVSTLTSCITMPITDPKSDKPTMLYGMIDMSEMGYSITSITMSYFESFDVLFGSTISVRVYGNGLFFAEDIKTGYYAIETFRSGNVFFDMPNKTKKEDYTYIKEGQLFYWGAFKGVQVEKADPLRQIFLSELGSYEVRPHNKHNRKTLLNMILEKVQGTGWEAVINRELKR
ncbi:MAG: hypothetical protein JW822_12200 [Spirochaetales bacterium]|nr:hypothetical protein [Spirochaetales bacterium]